MSRQAGEFRAHQPVSRYLTLMAEPVPPDASAARSGPDAPLPPPSRRPGPRGYPSLAPPEPGEPSLVTSCVVRVGAETHHLESLDVRLTGILLRGYPTGPMGQRAHLAFPLGGRTLTLWAQVVRVWDDQGTPCAALKFIGPTDEQRMRIAAAIDAQKLIRSSDVLAKGPKTSTEAPEDLIEADLVRLAEAINCVEDERQDPKLAWLRAVIPELTSRERACVLGVREPLWALKSVRVRVMLARFRTDQPKGAPSPTLTVECQQLLDALSGPVQDEVLDVALEANAIKERVLGEFLSDLDERSKRDDESRLSAPEALVSSLAVLTPEEIRSTLEKAAQKMGSAQLTAVSQPPSTAVRPPPKKRLTLLKPAELIESLDGPAKRPVEKRSSLAREPAHKAAGQIRKALVERAPRPTAARRAFGPLLILCCALSLFYAVLRFGDQLDLRPVAYSAVLKGSAVNRYGMTSARLTKSGLARINVGDRWLTASSEEQVSLARGMRDALKHKGFFSVMILKSNTGEPLAAFLGNSDELIRLNQTAPSTAPETARSE